MIEIKNLSKVYMPKNGVPVVALKNISINIEDKGMVVVLGKSGSGKSTLLNLLGGLDSYDEGEIKIYGKSSKDFSQSDFDSYRNTFIGFIFQEYNILDEFTVGQNIALALQLQRQKATEEQIDEILKKVDLDGFVNRKPNELSMGQLQRVAIARALIKNPEIIMADEPTGALDSVTGTQIFDTLKKISKEKLVIVVSHDREFAQIYADRIVELADGEIISDVKKCFTKGEILPKNFEINDNKIKVKKGYKLTLQDFKVIESGGKEINNEIEENENFVFKEINSEITLIKKPDKELKRIKSSLPFKNSFKIGVSSLKYKKFRLSLTIILSIVAYALFGVFTSYSSYKNYIAMSNTIAKNNISYLNIQNDVHPYAGNSQKNIKNSDIDYFEQLNPNADIFKVYNGIEDDTAFGSNLNITGFNNSLIGNVYFTSKFPGIIEVNYEKMEKFLTENEFNLIGELPNANDEIAITKYIYEYFHIGGLQLDEFGNYVNIPNQESLIGKQITIGFGDNKKIRLTVTGIIDTKLDDSQFAEYKTYEKSTKVYSEIQYQKDYLEFKSEVENGFHAMAIVNVSFIETCGNEKLYLVDKTYSDLKYSDENLSPSENLKISNSSKFYSDKILDSIFLKEEYSAVFFEEGKTKLENDEILLPYSIVDTTIVSNIEKSVLDYCNDINNVPLSIKDLAQELLNGLFSQYNFYCQNETPTDSDYSRAFYNWMQYSNPWDSTYCNKESIIRQINLNEISKGTANKKPEDFKVSLNLNNEIKNVKVVGYYLNEIKNIRSYSSSFSLYMPSCNFFIAHNIIEEMNLEMTGAYSSLIEMVPSTTNELNKVVKAIYTYTESGQKYSLVNSVSTDVNTLDIIISSFTKIFLYVAIALALFAFMFMTNYISTSISYKKREIGILRALGARGSDIFKIFSCEAYFIALINFVLSAVLTLLAIIASNFFMVSGWSFNVTAFNFTIFQILYLLGASLISATVSFILPVYNLSKKQPVDIIGNK